MFLDQGTLIVGVGGWAETMVDLADGVGGARSAASNAELAKLVNGVSSHTVWAAGLLPDKMRAQARRAGARGRPAWRRCARATVQPTPTTIWQ